jgi:hypothetical protein
MQPAAEEYVFLSRIGDFVKSGMLLQLQLIRLAYTSRKTQNNYGNS